MSLLKSLSRLARSLNPEAVDAKAVAAVVDSNKLKSGLTLLDGSMLQAGVIHASGYALMGTDHLGNKYYQRGADTTQVNRDRVVVYGPKFQNAYGQYDSSCVAPEWHGWLHHMTDTVPSASDAKPFFHLDKPEYDPAKPYFQKGHYLMGKGKRTWRKVEAWKPSA